jgi:hypothetical protein
VNDFSATGAGRIEDKWVEFVAECDERSRRALRDRAGRTGAACCIKRVEVHASYLWLFAGAILVWLIR